MKHNTEQNPILVTGAHRSGTTFVGKMLALPFKIGYIKEPFNKNQGLEGIDKWFLYIREGMEEEVQYNNLIWNFLHGKASYKRLPLLENKDCIQIIAKLLVKSRGNLDYLLATHSPFVKRYLIKDPIACLSSEYLHRVFKMDVVFLIRHPAAFVGSIKRLNWQFDFGNFYRQKELMDDHLKEILKDFKTDNLSTVEKAALVWKCVYYVLFRYLERNPKIIGIKHENLSRNPSKEFRQLYQRLHLPYSPRIDRIIRAYTDESNIVDPADNVAHVLKRSSRQNIRRWEKMLSKNEISAIKRITEDIAGKYYTEDEW